jgi:hypothetical protein
MKKLLYSLIILSAVFTSCGEDCELTDINEIIIGDWTLNGFDLSFNADGTIDDPDNAFESSINGIDLLDKTYELEGDTVLIVRSSNTNPPASLSTTFDIESYDCDEIKASAFITFTFKRK